MRWGMTSELAPTEAPTSLIGYLGPVPAGETRPPDHQAYDRQAFLVRMAPGRPVLRVHYHPVDQFQVFCWGDADFAGHRVSRGTVHYADRFSPYGPLAPGLAGVSFLTLRSESASGAHYMPESRNDLRTELASDDRRADQRRNVSFDLLEAPATSSWTDTRSDDDGLRVSHVRLEAHETSESVLVGGDGAFVAVLDGGIRWASDRASTSAETHDVIAGSAGWMDAGEVDEFTATAKGAVVALLQLPNRSAKHRR